MMEFVPRDVEGSGANAHRIAIGDTDPRHRLVGQPVEQRQRRRAHRDVLVEQTLEGSIVRPRVGGDDLLVERRGSVRSFRANLSVRCASMRSSSVMCCRISFTVHSPGRCGSDKSSAGMARKNSGVLRRHASMCRRTSSPGTSSTNA